MTDINEAPESIWAVAEPNNVSADILGDVYAQRIPDGMVGKPVKYIRADLAKPKVKPLVWDDDPHGNCAFECNEFGEMFFGSWHADTIVETCKTAYFAIYQHSPYEFMWVDGTLDNIRFSKYIKSWDEKPEIPWFACVADAKAAAQADYERRILSALE